MRTLAVVVAFVALVSCGPSDPPEIQEVTKLLFHLPDGGDVARIARIAQARLVETDLHFEMTITSSTSFEVMLPKLPKAEIQRVERIVTYRDRLEFRIVATEVVEQEERSRREELGKSYPGPPEGYLWVDLRRPAEEWEPNGPRLLVIPAREKDAFGNADLAPDSLTVRVNTMTGRRSVYFEILAERAPEFEAFTGRHVGRCMALVVDGRIESAPLIREALPGNGMIEGGGSEGFTEDEADGLVEILKSPSLPSPVELGAEIEIEERRLEKLD